MSVLPDHRIEIMSRATRSSLISPFDKDQLQPASYDCKLDRTILIPSSKSAHPIDTRKPSDISRYEAVDIEDGFTLAQGRFVLGATIERVEIPPDMVGRIEGKSSRARQGIQIHSAGYLDPGFRGNVTLEIVNFSPDLIVLYPNILIAQLSFEYLESRCERPYSEERNHYQDSVGVVGSRAS